MRVPFAFLDMLLGAWLAGSTIFTPASDLFEIEVNQLAEAWQKEHLSPENPYSFRHADLKERLATISAAFPEVMTMERAGTSVEGREIFLVRVGRGSESVLIWSQMHGDEPTATCALIDLLQYFGTHRREPWISAILQRYSLLIIPMLNPDGAERMQRRNAQGIDINRDARALQTPEGRVLKEIRDRYRPFLGFNLHNQNSTTTVGDTGRVATIALLAVAADVPGAEGMLAKKVTAVLYEALSPFVYGHISRYDEEFNPRAFGDNLTLWGTPVVLIESGGNPAGESSNYGVQLNFVGLSAVLNSLASGRVERANPAVFDALRLNSSDPIYDTILQNARIFTGTGIPPFRGDVAVRADMRAGTRGQAVIAEIGDLGVYTAHQTVDCSHYLITPGLIAWDPNRSLFMADGGDDEYLNRGVLTVLETARWSDLAGRGPAPGDWRARPRNVNWSFVVVGDSAAGAERDQVRLAEWLAAGSHAWIVDSSETAHEGGNMAEVLQWFGMAALTTQDALKFQLPGQWEGNLSEILPRYTSEAAARFGIGRRGVIAQGSVADLVLWSLPAGDAVSDLRECRPRYVMIDGRLIDLERGERGGYGRFLGR